VGGESSVVASTSAMTYVIHTCDPAVINHMVTLLKLKIDPMDCEQIIYFFPAIHDRIVFQQKILIWHFLFALHHSVIKRPQICIYGISR